MSRARMHKSLLAGLAVATVFGTAACGGTDDSSATRGGDGGIAETITIAQVQDQTGPVAYAGVGAKEGAELALEEINEQALPRRRRQRRARGVRHRR